MPPCHVEYYEVGTLAVDGWADTFGTARRGLFFNAVWALTSGGFRIVSDILFFHRWVATPFYFFPHQTSWQYSDGNPVTGASNAGGVGRNRNSEPISGSIACC